MTRLKRNLRDIATQRKKQQKKQKANKQTKKKQENIYVYIVL